MINTLRPAFVTMLLLTVLTGVSYPLLITGIAQVVLPAAANGSVVSTTSAAIGSSLIGQRFSSDKYFHGRPSAAGADGYDASASSGSNLGPLSKKLLDRVDADVAALRQAGAQAIPADAVTASASGLDAHISPAFAALQAARIATSRGVPEALIRQAIVRHTALPFLGVFGEPLVNVLELNLTLDAGLKSGAG